MIKYCYPKLSATYAVCCYKYCTYDLSNEFFIRRKIQLGYHNLYFIKARDTQRKQHPNFAPYFTFIASQK